MNRVALMGLGLMGGSLGLALKARGFAGTITAYARRAETRQAALNRGIADAVFDDPAEAVNDVDLAIYCTPILTIPDLIRASLPGLKPGAILTDVGSTKAALCREAATIVEGSGAVFVGSHPVAGSEQQGIEAARANLYEGALVVVTPNQMPEREATDAPVTRVKNFWSSLGALVSVVKAEEHDQLMARTSHLPHVVASILAATVGRDEAYPTVGLFCGTGFRDTSRVAEGSPDVWHDIIRTNAQAVVDELKSFRGALDRMVSDMERGDFEAAKAFLADAKEARRKLMAAAPVKAE